MKDRRAARIGLAFLALLLNFESSIRAQVPAATPQPPVFGANVSLVAVPVFVTDKNGRAVGGLTAADFEVEEAGKKVPIVAFQAIDVDAPETEGPLATMGSARPLAVQAEGPRQFLLLIDLEFSPPVGVLRGRNAATAFIREELAPGDLVAVATWGRSGLRVLTNFTTDHESAARALEGKGLVSNAGLDPLGLSGGFGTLAPTGARSDEDAAALDAQLTQLLAEEYATRVAAFLENISELVRKLSGLRGRKQLVLLSGGFRESAWNSAVSQGNRAEAAPNLARMKKIFEDAGRGDVLVHAISLYGVPGSLDLSSRTARSDSRTVDGSVDLRTGVDLASGRTTLTAFTQNTGGWFIQPTNDFGRALREVDRISRKSYVIAFETDAAASDDKPRPLKVRVRRDGVSVSHRASYRVPARLAIADGSTSRNQAAEAIAIGLTGGSLPLHVTTLPYRDRDGRGVVHSVLHIDGPALLSAARDGKLDLEVYGYLMQEGRVLDSVAANTALDLAQMGPSINTSGVRVLTAFPLSSAEADLRFFVRAANSDVSGSAREGVAAPVFTEGRWVLSPPLLNLPLAGRVAFPLQAKDRPRIEIPFRLGSEPFVPATPATLGARAQEVCVFVWPARDASAPPLEVTAELTRRGEAPAALALAGAPRIVRDSDGFDRLVLTIEPPRAAPGLFTLRLIVRDPLTGQVSRTETSVRVEK